MLIEIAGKLHELTVRDIELLPNILKQPLSVKTDKRKGKLYFGKRKSVNKFPYHKVVVRVEKDETETIITLCHLKDALELSCLFSPINHI